MVTLDVPHPSTSTRTSSPWRSQGFTAVARLKGVGEPVRIREPFSSVTPRESFEMSSACEVKSWWVSASVRSSCPATSVKAYDGQHHPRGIILLLHNTIDCCLDPKLVRIWYFARRNEHGTDRCPSWWDWEA